MRIFVILAVAALLVLAVTGCSQLRANIKSVVKVTVYDETGATYGYVSVKLLDENGVVKHSQNVNERGVTLFEGVKSGIYTFEVVNVNGDQLPVMSPEDVTVRMGKTTNVDIEVSRSALTEEDSEY
jgi:hypothetical protein